MFDDSANLMWQDNDFATPLIWLDANEFCENLGLSGYFDWHLPTLDELTGLYAIRSSLSSHTGGHYWTSTTAPYGSRYVKGFITGQVDYHSVSQYPYYVRCVRSVP